jgi:hypothetical protein
VPLHVRQEGLQTVTTSLSKTQVPEGRNYARWDMGVPGAVLQAPRGDDREWKSAR